MTETETSTNRPFEAEVQQLLDIVVHSLYTDREIFVRELVSNASDALEKLQHLQLTEREVFDDRLPLEISITTDEAARTLTIADYGIGMTRGELSENLGTIARSGSKVFRQALESRDAARANLIGQFGVGFYSAFMVADEVRVYTHSWREDGEHLVWISDGRTGYRIEEAPDQRRGCKVVVRLREDCAEFAKAGRIRELIEKHSNFVSFPILVNGERVNRIEALWLKNRSAIKDEEYDEFYKFTCGGLESPMLRLHFNAEAPLAIHALLYVPSRNPERLGMGQTDPGVALYCRKILIDAMPPGLLPDWLRFLKGVVDSEDLPLNISRESMQDSALVQKLNRVLTKRFLKFLDETARTDADRYLSFHREFGRFLKEGLVTGFDHRKELADLLRFESSHTESGAVTSFADYLARADENQQAIYYQIAPNRKSIESGPYLEAFRARGIEVLYLLDPIDEYVVNSVGEHEGKRLVAIDSAEADPGGTGPLAHEAQDGPPLADEALAGLCDWMRESLGPQVTVVRGSSRLVSSPAAALTPADGMSPQLRQMMKAMNPGGAPPLAVELEVNPRHPLIKGVAALRERDPDVASLVATQIRDNALMAAGLLDDPGDMVDRLYRILGKVVGNEAAGDAIAAGPPEAETDRGT